MAVGKIHLGVVRAPAHAVGDPDVMVDGVQMPALKPIEKAARALHRLAHGADPKSSAPVAAAVIEDVDGAAGNQQSSTHARRKRAELFWRRPAFERCAHGVQTMNGRFECVDPIEHLLGRMPARNLAEDILGVRDTCNFDHDDLSSNACHAPRVKNSAKRFFWSLPVTVSGSSASLT